MLKQLEIESEYLSGEAGRISLAGKTLVDFARACLDNNKSFRFKAGGTSMSPFIKDGDILTISPLTNPPRLGALVAFTRPFMAKKLVVHRIVSGAGNYCIIKGDGCPDDDGFIARDRMIGAVTKIERSGCRVLFGLGAERYIIALFSRYNLLPFIFFCWKLIPFPVRQAIKRRL